MCNVLKWRISKLESKIDRLESEKNALKKRLAAALRVRNTWSNSYTTQKPTSPSMKN